MGLRLLGYHYNVSDRLREYYRLDGGFAKTPRTLQSDPYSTLMGVELAELAGLNLAPNAHDLEIYFSFLFFIFKIIMAANAAAATQKILSAK